MRVVVAFSTLSWACSSAFRFSRPASTGPAYYYSKNPLLLLQRYNSCYSKKKNCVRLFATEGTGTTKNNGNRNGNSGDCNGDGVDDAPLFSLALLPIEQQKAFLIEKSKEFISYKNSAGCGDNSLEPVFDMISFVSYASSGSSNNYNYNADIYGLIGEQKIRPGLEFFFAEYQNLQHQLLLEPICVDADVDVDVDVDGPDAYTYTVQYPFVKSWRILVVEEEDNNNSNTTTTANNNTNNKWEDKTWSSIDPTKQPARNKVERLWFDDQGMLIRVAVVEATSPVEPPFPVTTTTP